MNRLAKIITQLGPQELVLIQKDLEAGTLSKLVSHQLQEYQQGQKKVCPTCGKSVRSNSSFKLEFGSSDLRRQAHFDATDCLQHFIENTLKKKEATIQ
jgi:predicted GNAT family acetyltransferase